VEGGVADRDRIIRVATERFADLAPDLDFERIGPTLMVFRTRIIVVLRPCNTFSTELFYQPASLGSKNVDRRPMTPTSRRPPKVRGRGAAAVAATAELRWPGSTVGAFCVALVIVYDAAGYGVAACSRRCGACPSAHLFFQSLGQIP
jgi:hypothetical protein